MGAGDLALKPRQCRQQTGRLPSILPVLPILFRALVVAPRGVPSLGVSGQKSGPGLGLGSKSGPGLGLGSRSGPGLGPGSGSGSGVLGETEGGRASFGELELYERGLGLARIGSASLGAESGAPRLR